MRGKLAGLASLWQCLSSENKHYLEHRPSSQRAGRSFGKSAHLKLKSTLMNDQQLTELAQRLGLVLLKRDEMLATAESCTGGWIAKVLTDIAGSSGWFERGLVTYSNAAKQELLGVAENVLAQHGAVSAATVTAMASGALQRSHAQHAVAVSGVAGPGGGSADKPVGTVWIGWAHTAGTSDCRTRCQQFLFPGDREQIRRATVFEALQGLLSDLDERDGTE